MIHNQLRLDADSFFKDLPVFDEHIVDYGRVQFDPREDPLFINHAFKNNGKFPPEFEPLFERHCEDQAKMQNKKFVHWKKIRDLSFQRVERNQTIERS